MSATGLSTFDETVQLSNQWLNELMLAVDWEDKHRPTVSCAQFCMRCVTV